MKSLSVIELSKLYGINRQTIYNNINKGILSKNSDNKIDLSEAIRVFGEPAKKQDVKEPVKIDSPNSAEVLLLRQQIDMLKNQLDDAKDRADTYKNPIDKKQVTDTVDEFTTHMDNLERAMDRLSSTR